MATIRLNSEYYVEVDAHNYTLKKIYEGQDKSGNVRTGERVIGYYGTLTGAVTEYVRCACDNTAESFDGSIKGYAEIVDNAAKSAVSELKAVLERIE